MDDRTGGPAFPWLDPDKASGLPEQSPGMSLRAYFAGRAIDAAMNLCLSAVRGNPTSRAPTLREMAGVAVEIADALIAKLAEVP